MKTRALASMFLWLTVIYSAIGYPKISPIPQGNPQAQLNIDPRFEALSSIYERRQRAERYVSKLKARYAANPRILAEVDIRYGKVKDKFDAYLNTLGGRCNQ